MSVTCREIINEINNLPDRVVIYKYRNSIISIVLKYGHDVHYAPYTSVDTLEKYKSVGVPITEIDLPCAT